MVMAAQREYKNYSGEQTAFTLLIVGITTLFALVAAFAPVQLSIAIVILFAGAHNWFELRYVLSRFPARFGKIRPFFIVAIAGVFLLAISFIILGYFGQYGLWSSAINDLSLSRLYKVWNTAFVFWLLALISIRNKERSNDYPLALPIAAALLAVNWISAPLFGLMLVYAHPLIGLLILRRETTLSKPQLQGVSNSLIVVSLVALTSLLLILCQSQNLNTTENLTDKIARHAGALILPGVSSHLLVSVHVFLELVHYFVWIVAIPYVTLGSRIFSLAKIPLICRSSNWRPIVGSVLVTGVALVVLLQTAFTVDFSTARDIYFTIAILHVLAEFPVLLRLM